MLGGRVGKYFYHVFISSHLNHIAVVRGFMEYVAKQESGNGFRTSFPHFSDERWPEFLRRVRDGLRDAYPELQCLGPFPPRYKMDERALMREFQMHSWWQYYGDQNAEKPRVVAIGFLPGSILEMHNPGLGEKMLDIARTVPEFLLGPLGNKSRHVK